MILFAAAIGGLIHLIILLVAFGVWVINTFVRKRGENGEEPRRQGAPRRPPVRAGVNPMEPHDVDQFLDEVLGRGRPAQPPGPPPMARPADVIVLRPGAPPPVPQRRQPQRRPARPVVQRPGQPRRGGPSQPPSEQQTPRSAFSQSINDSVDRAAAATGSAGTATTDAGEVKASSRTAGRQASVGNDILAMLRSPADVRRALVLREILGPPLALRRRQR